MKIAAILAVAGLAGIASAQLVIPAAITDTVISPASGNVDDNTYTPAGAAAFNLTGFTLFGAPVTPANLRVNNNGWLSFGGASNAFNTLSNSWTNAALPFTSATAGTAMIAPLWDDLYITGAGTGLTSKSVRVATPDAGTYVVTWQGMEAFLNTSPDLNFQAILLGNGNGFGAIPGTIVFSYGTMLTGTFATNATVGLNAGNASGNAFIPTYGGGLGTAALVGGLANSAHSFVPNAAGGYDYVAGVVPAPGALALLGLGGLVAGRRNRR